jgi:putative ABC transport system permease protein
VLLIACANVANLQIARSASRERELAIRGALGATRGGMLRMLLVESLVLSAVAGGLALLAARWALQIIQAYGPTQFPRLADVALDPVAVGFTAVVVIGCAVAAGLAPALHAMRADVSAALGEGARVGGGARPARIRRALLVAEVALALVLLVAAGLLLRSISLLRQVDPGFEPGRLIFARVSLPPAPGITSAARLEAFRAIEARLAGLNGVRAVGGVNMAPLHEGYSCDSFGLEDRTPPPAGEEPCAEARMATPGYFHAAGVRVLQGRPFGPDDVAGREPVVIVNDAMARKYWGERSPVGIRFKWGSFTATGPWRRIVGVVGSVRHFGLDQEPAPEVYTPYAQNPVAGLTFAVRADGDPAALTGHVRDAIRQGHPSIVIQSIRTGREAVDRSIATERFRTALLGAFASLALVLALVGIYAVTASSVSERAREIGVRMALGARAGDVVRMVVTQAMTAAGAGLLLGLAGALALSRLLSSLLFGVGPRDALTYASVSILLLAAALVSSYLPARRATRIDPIATLRAE